MGLDFEHYLSISWVVAVICVLVVVGTSVLRALVLSRSASLKRSDMYLGPELALATMVAAMTAAFDVMHKAQKYHVELSSDQFNVLNGVKDGLLKNTLAFVAVSFVVFVVAAALHRNQETRIVVGRNGTYVSAFEERSGLVVCGLVCNGLGAGVLGLFLLVMGAG